MTTKITMNESNIGTDCTPAQAKQMVAALRDMGHNVAYGESNDIQDADGAFELDSINDADWGRALASIK